MLSSGDKAFDALFGYEGRELVNGKVPFLIKENPEVSFILSVMWRHS
jgi:hypothetical protein